MHAESTEKWLTFDHAKNHYTMSTRYEIVEVVLEFIDGPSYMFQRQDNHFLRRFSKRKSQVFFLLYN